MVKSIIYVRSLNDLSQLDNVTLEELKDFINLLTDKETKFYNIYKDKVLNSLIYVKGLKYDGKLIGIGGIAKWYCILPHVFYMIKDEYQGQGLGRILVESNIKYAEGNFKILLNVVDKANIRAVKLSVNHGFKVAGFDKLKIYCYYPLGKLDWFAKLAIKVRTVCYRQF